MCVVVLCCAGDAKKEVVVKKETKKKGPAMVALLDAKRSNNISIMLAQFRISFQDIKIAILELNEDILCVTLCRGVNTAAAAPFRGAGRVATF